MNKIYKVVWNAARNCYVVGSEFISKTRRGEGYRSNVTTAGARTLLAVCAACGISFYSGGLAVAADNLQTEPTIVIEVQEQKNEAVQPELLYSQLAAASASADALDITMPADVPAAAEDTSEAPAVDVSSQHSIHDENGYYVYNGTENDTYNSLTKDGLWVGGVDDKTGFHVDNTGHASANGLDVQKQKITGVADGTSDSDAATYGQVKDVDAKIGDLDFSDTHSLKKAENVTDALTKLDTKAYNLSGKIDDFSRSGIMAGGTLDSRNAGTNSIQLGNQARAAGQNSIAFGAGASVTGENTEESILTRAKNNGVAIGYSATAAGFNTTVLGAAAKAQVDNATALGQGTLVTADNSVALGAGSRVTTDDIRDSDTNGVVSVGKSDGERRIINVADGVNDSDAATVGQISKITGMDSEKGNVVQYDGEDKAAVTFAGTEGTALKNVSDIELKGNSFVDAGLVAGTTTTKSTLLGNATAENNMILGDGAEIYVQGALGKAASVENSMAIGQGAEIHAQSQGSAKHITDSIAFGQDSYVSASNSVAIGAGSTATEEGVVSVGSANNQRRIVNVADGNIGENSIDAVNGSQLYAVREGAVSYGTKMEEDMWGNEKEVTDYSIVTLRGENGTKLTNLADGEFKADSTDAVTAGQLYAAGITPGDTRGNAGSVAMGGGYNNYVLGANGTAIGYNAGAGENAVAIGNSAAASHANATAVGQNSNAMETGATAFGQHAWAEVANSTAIGYHADVEYKGDNSVALGANSIVATEDILDTDTAGVVSVGSSGHAFNSTEFNRRIINVADGVNDSDAATVKQVKDVQGDVDELNKLAVTYTDNTKKAVNFNGATLKNVGDIQIGNAQSTFAGSGLVNGKVYDTDAGQWAENGANATHSMAVGKNSSVRGTDSVAVGPEAAVNNGNAGGLEQSTAVGSNATVTNSFSTALGANTQAKGDYSVAIGAQSQTTGDNATAIGAYAAAGENSVVVGGGEGLAAPTVSKANSTAMGTYVDIKSDNGTALGYGSQVGGNGRNSVALGADSVANEENVVSVGHTKDQANGFGETYGEDLNRRIINVADGTIAEDSHDAVTGGQLYATNQNVADNADKLAAYEKSGIEAGAISGKTTSQNLAIGQNSKIAADGNVTHNVAIGNGATVEAGLDYTDPLKPQRADNVTYATAVGAEAKATGNGSTVYGAGSSTSSDYSTAIGRSAKAGQGAGDKATALGYNAQATDGDTLAAGANSKAWAAGSVALGADTTVNYGADNSVALGTGSEVSISDIKDSDVNGVVSVGSDGGERRIINVADGTVAEGSHDAVTGGQLYNVQSSVTALDASAVQYDSVSKSTVTFDGANGTALKNVSDIVMNTKDFYSKNAQFSFQDAGLLPGDVQSLGNKWNMAIGEGSAVKVEKGTGSKMQMNTVVGNKARITQALVDGEYQDVEKSTALGQGVTVAASNAVGVGQGSNVRGEGGVAVGMQANVSAKSGVAVGKQSKVSSDYSIAIGGSASVGSESENSVAMGYDASSLAAGGTAIGQGAKVQGSAANGTAIGKGAIVNVNAGNSVALGASSQVQTADIGSDTEYGVVSVGKSGTNGFTRRIVNVADGLNDSDAATVGQLNAMQSAYTDSGIVGGTMDKYTLATGAVAIGKDSKVHGTGSVAIGTGSKVEQHNSVAIGRSAIVKGAGSVALGAGSVATEDNVLSLGRNDGSLGLRIVNMKDGINERDAVTVGQMNALALGDRNASLSLANGATNLADGIDRNTTDIKSLDEQLNDVEVDWGESTQRMKELTEKASAFAAQTQNVDWNALNSVDWNAVSAMAAVPATMNLAVDDVQANEGDTGAEKDDDDRSPQTNGSNPGEVDGDLHVSGNTTLDGTLNVKGDATFEGNATFDKGATMKGDLNMSGNKITGLGAGDVSADSTDAVNGSQLFDVQQQVSDNRNAIGALGSRVSDLGEEVDSVGAISAALAGLHPLDYNGTGSKFQISAALGTYDGTQAAAIGGFYHFNRDTLLSIGGSTSFEGDRKTAANVGVTFRVGEGASEAPAVQDNETKQQMEAMKQEIEMLKAELEQLKNKDTEGTNDKN